MRLVSTQRCLRKTQVKVKVYKEPKPDFWEPELNSGSDANTIINFTIMLEGSL